MNYRKIAACLAVFFCQIVFVQAGIFQINAQPGHQGQPVIWADWIVFSDIQQPDLGADIYAKNLATGEVIQISDSGLAETADIYANTIVWADQRNGDYDLFSYDLSTRTESQLYSAPGDQINPAIHAGKVVFMTGDDPYTRQVCLYSIGQQQVSIISSVPGYKWKPDIFANIVVWGDYRNGNWDIYGYDIVSQTEFLIAGGEDYQRTAAIYAGRVVYENNTNEFQGPSYIGIYDLGTTEHSYLEVPNTVDWPDIYGNILVWAEYTNATATNIYGYDLSDDTEYTFCAEPGWQYSPKIYADTIVWASDETSSAQWHDRDIYGYDLDLAVDTPPIITFVTASPFNITDAQTSQLQVNASDPDSGPAALSYNWIIPAGAGSLSSTSISNPVYTPPDVTGTQNFTLTVEVSDGEDVISSTVSVTVNDADISIPTTLLFEDFYDGDFDGWSIIDEGTMFAPSSWSAANGSMLQSSNINSEPFLASDLNKLGTIAVYNAPITWSDYKVDLTMRSDDNDQIGLLFRYQDTGNYYKFCWNKQFATRKLLKKVDQTVTLLAADSVPYVTGQNYQVQITATGSNITVAIDGTTIFSVTDNSLLSGTIALYCWANAGSIFDNITVEDLSISNKPPAISSIWAWPATIMDNQTSQLNVTADDPDSSPAPLTYNWIIPAGAGSLSSTSISNPVYTPPDVLQTPMFRFPQPCFLKIFMTVISMAGRLSMKVLCLPPRHGQRSMEQ
ncbi:MAG: family 16 glycoside hydrolase [Planctomycetota bacterium]|jgi:beta propeller repeat protein